MRNEVDKLRGAVGRGVSAVAVEVQFYRVETKGSLSAVLIDFTDGAQFAMGCAGDGSVFVFRSRGNKRSAPGFVIERRTVADLDGELRGVSIPPRALRLEIGEHELMLVNEDDELSLTVDGKALPQRIVRR
jgi:hypothetical protein